MIGLSSQRLLVITEATLGQEWLKARLDVSPTAGWHMDPFGNSAISPLLFDGYGFDAHVVSGGRLPTYRLGNVAWGEPYELQSTLCWTQQPDFTPDSGSKSCMTGAGTARHAGTGSSSCRMSGKVPVARLSCSTSSRGCTWSSAGIQTGPAMATSGSPGCLRSSRHLLLYFLDF